MDVQEFIQQQVTSHPVVLYMKGLPTLPQCGFFSAQRASCNGSEPEIFGVWMYSLTTNKPRN